MHHKNIMGTLALGLLMVAVSIALDSSLDWLHLSLEIVDMTFQDGADVLEPMGSAGAGQVEMLLLLDLLLHILQK